MQDAGNAVRRRIWLAGSGEALITTAAGMVVALGALVLHSLVEAVAGNFKTNLEQVATRSIARASAPLNDAATAQQRSSVTRQQSAA